METEVFWRAIQTRDAKFDGAFVFGVKTTGIFCRPSCPARAAKRENVKFFDEVASAEFDGFRACLRCKPKLINAVDPQVEMVMRACRIMLNDTDLSLGKVSEALDLSPSYFQRTFKEVVGISPKKYSEMKRIERFKSEIRDGSGVVTAMYEAGYNSSSRLYEKAVENLGMTPAIYKKGGKGMEINYVTTHCVLGKLLVARTPRGLCCVTFGDSIEQLETGLASEFPSAKITKDDSELRSAVEAIIKYLAGSSSPLILALDLRATAFQLQVWEMLRKIPYGETRSYTEIAEAIGDRKKVRAVAQACARNRVAVVIPCHRVIAGDGRLSGYRWGIERKESLLKSEGAR